MPSSQGSVVCVKTQPFVGSQESVVQGLLSLQVGGVPFVQRLATHVSVPLQMLWSLQSPSEKQQFGIGG